MSEQFTPEHYRAAAQAARERESATADRSLKLAYKQLALDYDALAESIERLRKTQKSIDDAE